jgi:hypothetical protein
MPQTLPGNQPSHDPDLRILSDRPIEADSRDHLGFTTYADALAELLDHPETDTPLTLAISAPWGAGKTSLAKMVERRLLIRPTYRGDASHITCWFNAWMHDDAPHLGAAFAAEVAKTANQHRPKWRRILSPLPSAMLSPQQQWRRRIVLGLISFAVALFLATISSNRQVTPSISTFLGTPWLALWNLFFYKQLSIFILLLAVFTLTRKVFGIAESAAKFVDDPKSEAAKGSMHQVAEQLGQLIRQATHQRRRWLVIPRRERRFVIFVDDLERCRPPRAIEVCEVASQLLGHSQVVTVLVADMSAVAASAQTKYAALEGFPLHLPYGRLYLQKIVQIQFNLPTTPQRTIPGILSGPRLSEEVNAAVKESEQYNPVSYWWAAALMLVILVTLGILSFAATSVLVGNGLPVPATVGILATGLFFGWMLTRAFLSDLRSYLSERARQRVDRVITMALEDGMIDEEEIRAAVLGSRVVTQRRKDLISQRVLRLMADASAHRNEVESAIYQYLPTVPRSAKRALNQLRILLVIAEKRKMLGGSPKLEPKHIAKWAIFLERWPELGSILSSNPMEMSSLEAAASLEELAEVLNRHLPNFPVSEELFDFLRKGELLAPFTDRLVYFQAAL